MSSQNTLLKIYKLYGKYEIQFSTPPVCRKPFVNKINSYTRIQILTYVGKLGQLHEIFNNIFL